MKIFITGGTGFVGQVLIERLLEAGEELIVGVRSLERDKRRLPERVTVCEYPVSSSVLEGVDAIVNLAGAPVAGTRWTVDYKKRLVSSRVDLTRSIVEAAKGCKSPPKVLVSASAVGIYGNETQSRIDESGTQGSDFLAQLCKDWEREASEFPGRVVLARIGIVIGRGGGIVGTLAPIFSKGLGGPLGNGRQCLSWIHVEDLCSLVEFSLENEIAQGPVNAVAKEPITNKRFSESLARALGTKSRLAVPAFALKIRFGESARVMLANHSVVSTVQDQWGFDCKFTTIDEALASSV